ncbi:ATP-dependent helicase HrpB [Gracilinema caldarium]|uniref:ATP-dependent helicase HrpB n=1 Tax=Gracilinema caldarium TaxID=215591 RepID=UPI0026F0BB80|nr:ATP-dependent helicase HrpB [Gracilinema caldarium]
MNLNRNLTKTELPLLPWLPEIVNILRQQGRLILQAEPGSGKSTLVPLALLDLPGSIVMLEPRRIAAIGIASRMAELLEEPLGKTVGYSVRGDRCISRESRIEVLTEGLLARRIQTNPELPEVSTIIFDEFHERSLFTDLSFALVLDLCRIRPDLKILLMSATMDCDAIAEHLNKIENRQGADKVQVLNCPGKTYPVETEYRPPRTGESIIDCCGRTIRSLLEESRRAVPQGTLSSTHQYSSGAESYGASGYAILAFLPGRREIAAVYALLADLGPHTEVLPLHGSLPLSEQRRVLGGAEPGTNRVILATNIAETSLTVPDVSIVVDTGLVRLQRYHLRTGMDRLSLEAASIQSADQRRGRAGRIGPGRCIRLWAPQETRPAATEPEILRLDLASLVLESALWGALDREALPWLEAPPRPAWESGKNLLTAMGSLDQEGRPTETGRQLAHLALHPRLGMLALAGREKGDPVLGALLAALLSERDPSGFENEADIRLRLEAFTSPIIPSRYRAAVDLALDILSRLDAANQVSGGSKNKDLRLSPQSIELAGTLLARAFPDRICRRQESGNYRFTSGREAMVKGSLAQEEWLVAPDADAGERSGYIYLASPISKLQALHILEPQTESTTSIIWNGLVPRTVVSERAGRLVLQETQRRSDRTEVSSALTELLKNKGLEILPWDENAEANTGSHRSQQKSTARQLLNRIRFQEKRLSETSHDAPSLWSDEALIAEAERWIGPFVWNGKDSGEGPILSGETLLMALKNHYGWEELSALDKEVPAFFVSPAGTSRPIDYTSGEPVVSIRIQEVYGLVTSPLILGLPLTFELLSPAGRPIQITRDLGRFWTGSYKDVRKEMRGRYPKHDWPEDPLNAQPHARVAKS